MRAERPSRSRPASARMSASTRSLIEFADPCFDVAAEVQKLQIGPQEKGAAPAGGRLPVPIRALSGKSRIPVGRKADRAGRTRASQAEARSGTAASQSPSTGTVGRSFRLCTATSARLSSRACWISRVKTPTPPRRSAKHRAPGRPSS